MIFDYLKRGSLLAEKENALYGENAAEVTAEVCEPEIKELTRTSGEIDLSRIIPAKRILTHGNSRFIPVAGIKPNPSQPRLEIDADALGELAASIERYGLMQPITVRRTMPFEYELVAGQRRLEACRMLGMDYIQAIVMQVDETDSAVLALVENIQRENLNYMEEAEAYLGLLTDSGMTQEQLAAKLGKSQSAVANKLRILKLPIKVRALLSENGLTERHARALLRLGSEKEQLAALDKIVKNGLNVAKTEAMIERFMRKKQKRQGVEAENKKEDKPAPMHRSGTFRDVRIFSNTIKKAVELMNRSGVDAACKKSESEKFIEYIIKIPK